MKKTNPKWTNAQNECIISSLSATYGAGAVSAIYELIKKARWGDAAKKLLKLGIKGTVPGILFSLGATAGACGKEASKKYPRYI